MLDIPLTLTVEQAHRRYEAIRPRLPQIGPSGPASLAGPVWVISGRRGRIAS